METFPDPLHAFSIKKASMCGGTLIDRLKIFCIVEDRGGFEVVCTSKLWRKVADALGVRSSCTNAAYILRRFYAATFLPNYNQCLNYYIKLSNIYKSNGYAFRPITRSIVKRDLEADGKYSNTVYIYMSSPSVDPQL